MRNLLRCVSISAGIFIIGGILIAGCKSEPTDAEKGPAASPPKKVGAGASRDINIDPPPPGVKTGTEGGLK